MVKVKCSVPNCQFETDDASEALVIAILTNHGLAHQNSQPVSTAQAPVAPRGPKLERPKVDIGVTTEGWNVFVRRWDVFRSGSGIDEASAPSQLFQCAGTELGDSLLKANPKAASDTLPELLAAMRSLAVIPIATGVLRTELLQLQQERDEPFRAFAAKVRGKAETCEFTAECECGKEVDYTNHSIRDVLLNGIYDPDIRREVLGTKNILKTSVNDVIALVENKEMARNALPSSNLPAVSSFQHLKNAPTPSGTQTPSHADKAKEATCPDCKGTYKIFTEGARGWNTKPHQVCITCYRARRRKKRQQRSPQFPTPNVQAVESEPISQIGGVQTDSVPSAVLDHHIFSKGEWRRAHLLEHPRIPITISVDKSAQRRHSRPIHTPTAHAEVSAIADTGAQSNLWSLEDFLAHGFSREDLRPVRLSLTAANRSPIKIEGAFFAVLMAKSPSGKTTSCRSMVYVSSSVKAMFLSYESLLDLGLISNDFWSPDHVRHKARHPSNADSPGIPSDTPSNNAIRTMNDGCSAPHNSHDASCSCPQREVSPPRPSELPFPCTPENNKRLKAWLLDRYAASTFNTCPHRALPCMEGPPVEIHVDPTATPKACHTPANEPLHWQQRVHDDLLRDEALGVIERVPYGEPVIWCHRMVITRKHDGSPRRTVDLSPLNKFCRRETFAMETPFHLARRIPKDTWKTVMDAWNGYHSVPLRQSDRHLTTFITPFGRWRYTRAPQGFLSSGDGYNRRFDAVLSTFERKERCVDDTIHYDSDLEQHWWRTIDLLTRVGRTGIVLNPDKFQFAEKSVDFAGFRVSDTTIEPLPKYLDAIRDFPSPSSTTDIRSWFGLVNQVANYAQLRDIMAPFKPFLSPRYKFSWSPDLEEAFQKSKEAIVEAIRQGVEIFDTKKRTCLRPDWSKRGIGYFLLQQHCRCSSGLPDCCPGGWQITLAGSRFLSSAEQRYAAIEGEALAVAWGLEQTRYFTQGCDNLIVVTDHKPLVKIFGDRTLDEISNSRLFRLKQRTLPWRFEMHHLPGKSNSAADATSRHPSPSGSTNGTALESSTIADQVEKALMASISKEAQELGTISWSLIAQETATDTLLSHLLQRIEQGTQHFDRNDPAITPLWPICESAYVQEGVLLYQDRVVVPSSLRHRVLQHLHAAHQGTSSMEQRARAIVYWPGMSKDIRETRERCADCNRNAPSQPATPPTPSAPPSTPFEAVFADFFNHGGHHYLVVGDRLSGWVEVFGSAAGTNLAGAAELMSHLRSFFATFGVPEELSSDGGPEFTAGPTERFLRNWGVRHRLSSAYFPQSNGRAEVAVKTAKRLLMSNTGPTGSLNHDRFLQAMLQLRNTPDPDCNVSPAQIIFGRPLRDTLSFINRLEKFSNPHVHPTWRQAWAAKEDALCTRLTRTTESLKEHSRPLRPLGVGERVFLQNQQGPSPTKWDRSGVVVEAPGHDQYRVKVDGSGRLTLRNRRFLRAYTLANPSIDQRPKAHQPPPFNEANQKQCLPCCPPEPRLQTLTHPTYLQGNSPSLVAPRSTSTGISPLPTTGSPAPSHVPLPNESPETKPMDNEPEVEPSATQVVAPQSPQPSRPSRERRPPKRFEPETGRWL